jgi:Mg-chelatase subunit ChlD
MAQDTSEIAAALMVATGFQLVGNNDLLAKLQAIVPNGRTAMRDSLLAGISLILKLNTALQELSLAETWNFVHIVITDGQDTASRASLQDTAKAMLMVGQAIPVSRCKTIIIGIDLGEDRQATAELVALRQFGGENCEIYEIGAVDIAGLFDRIQVSLGVMRETRVGVAQSPTGERAVVIARREQAVMQVSRTSFAIVFNIDISGSMRENGRYERVKRSVAQFLQKCPSDDLVSGICFSDTVTLLGPMQVNRAPAITYQPNSAASSYSHQYQPQPSGDTCCCTVF